MAKATSERRAALAKVHLAKKDLALSDDSYRDLLERETGQRSAAALSDAQLNQVLRRFRDLGWRPRIRSGAGSKGSTPQGRAQAAKARALWLALWQLGEVREPGGRALDAFVERQAEVASLAWATPAQLNTVIEALKDWCTRAGFEVPETTGDGGAAAKQALIRALWARLCGAGAVEIPNDDALWRYADRVAGPPRRAGLEHMDLGQLDRLVERLGAWLRNEDGRRW